MIAQDEQLRGELQELAGQPRGRELLQLALRGLQVDERPLTAGCWVRGGVAGCLFQHAYWQGVREGVFADDGSSRDWVSAYAGEDSYWNVIRTIAAFDDVARNDFLRGPARWLPLGRRALRSDDWRRHVESMLVDALDRSGADRSPAVTAGD
jgi:hypothetical protein